MYLSILISLSVYLCLFIQALEMLTQSLDLTPQIVTYTELGRLYLMRGDIAKATEIYRRATK